MEEELEPFVDIKINQLDEIEKSILFIGLYELNHHIETPYRVVINESVELAKRFGGTDSNKFINGVMDILSKDIRTLEHSYRTFNLLKLSSLTNERDLTVQVKDFSHSFEMTWFFCSSCYFN